MDREARQFRHDAARHLGGRTGTAVRYTPVLRRSGVAVAAIARELGVCPRALRLWLEPPRSKPGLRRVAVATTPDTATTLPSLSVLVTEHGVRVDGLDLATLVALLRGLR